MDMEDDMVPRSLYTPEKSNNAVIDNVVSPNNDNGLDEKAESPGDKHHCAAKYVYLQVCAC
jgi:hypothetical protein